MGSIYKVYQCKREQDFSRGKIESAVDEFLKGEWVQKSEFFILCTQDPLRTPDRQLAIEEQAKKLKTSDVTFVPWDGEQLSSILKDLPEIVDDFFGRAWVKAFCSEEAASKLGNRLDLQAQTKLRSGYLSLYKYVFSKHDPGVPPNSAGTIDDLELIQRFVPPMILSTRQGIVNQIQNSQLGKQNPDESDYTPDPVVTKVRKPIEFNLREEADSWLANSSYKIILGDPGSGKSSLLRFVALDLLRENPVFINLISKWSGYLPVWVPFGQWTKKIAENNTELKTILLTWLNNYSLGELTPLLEQAIEQKKILLLIDGLDEWFDESAINLAMDQIYVFIRQYDVPIFMSSRPAGFSKLGIQDSKWDIGTIAGFNYSQQKQLAEKWFRHRLTSCDQTLRDDEAKLQIQTQHEAEQFINELYSTINLQELSKYPLLLTLLIFLKFQNAQLPQNRFNAYRDILENLVVIHPALRRRAAILLPTKFNLTNEDLKKVYAYLAYKIQLQDPEGTITKTKAFELLSDYLSDSNGDFGLSLSDSKKLTQEILEFGETTSGLLVMRSPDELGFFHRVFQEYLTASFINSLSLDKQKDLLDKHIVNTQWREVTLSLFSLNTRTSDLDTLINYFKEKPCLPPDKAQLDSILYEVAFGDFSISPPIVRELTATALDNIQTKPWLPERDYLFNLALNGLNSIKTKDIVLDRITYGYPCRDNYRSFIYERMEGWQFDEQTNLILKRAIFDENIDNQRFAALALSRIGKGNIEIKNWLFNIAQLDLNLNASAAALNAIIATWHEPELLEQIVSKFTFSNNPMLKTLAIKSKIILGKHTNDDLETLLRLTSSDNPISHYWEDLSEDVLLMGWSQNDHLKEVCLSTTSVDRNTARRILLKGFPHDREVAEYFVNEINREPYPLNGLISLRFSAWDILAMNFKNEASIVEAIDLWLPKQEHDIATVSRAALVGCTQTAKEKLIKSLDDHWSFWAAEALLEGWGMSDPEVSTALNEMLSKGSAVLSRIGQQIPDIVLNKVKSRQILLDLLKDPLSERADMAVRGFVKLGNTKTDEEVASSILSRIQTESDYNTQAALIRHCILNYSECRGVRDLAVNELTKRDGCFDAVAASYGNDPEIKKTILTFIAPLDSGLRNIVANRLSEFTNQDILLTKLEHYDQEVDSSVKTLSSLNYHKHLVESGKDTSAG